MTRKEITQAIKDKYNIDFEDVYWEIDSDGEAMIMLDESTDFPDDLWHFCYNSGYREDYNGNIIEIND